MGGELIGTLLLKDLTIPKPKQGIAIGLKFEMTYLKYLAFL